jgi:hypothetical protein
MTPRPLALLLPTLLLTAAGCGSGRLVPSQGEPTPSSSPEPAASPAPAPSPAVAQAPAAPAAPAPGAGATPDSGASRPGVTGYAPYGGGGTPIQIRRIGQYSQSGITVPQRLVIRDDASYARFWSSLGIGGERPLVDFTRDVVLAVAGGQRSTGGYSIAVERVVRTATGAAIEVVETTPGPGCIMTQALTQPVDVVVVAAADAESWEFGERRVEQGCR